MDPDFDDDQNMVTLWQAWQAERETEAMEAEEQGRPAPKEPEEESTYQPGDEVRSVDGGSSRLSPCSVLSDDENVTSTHGQVAAATITSLFTDESDDDATTTTKTAAAAETLCTTAPIATTSDDTKGELSARTLRSELDDENISTQSKDSSLDQRTSIAPCTSTTDTTTAAAATVSEASSTATPMKTTAAGSKTETAARTLRLQAARNISTQSKDSSLDQRTSIAPSTSTTDTTTAPSAAGASSSIATKKKYKKRKKKQVAKEMVKRIVEQLLRSRRGEDSESEISAWEGEFDPNELDTTNMSKEQLEVYKKEQRERKKQFHKKKQKLIEQNEILQEAGLSHLMLPTSISEMSEKEKKYTREAMTAWLVTVPSEVKKQL